MLYVTRAHPLDDLRITVREELTGVGIQCRNAFHVVLFKLEIKNVEVLDHAFGTNGFGNDDSAKLVDVTQHDLAHRAFITMSNALKRRMREQIVFALGKGCPGLGRRAELIQNRKSFLLLTEGFC